MNTKISKTLYVLSFVLLLVLIVPGITYAQDVDVTITKDLDVIKVGDVFEITVTFHSNNPIGTLDAGLKYDNNLIHFNSGGGNAAQLSNGIGGITDMGSAHTNNKTYTFRFTAQKSGTASFSVVHSEITGFNNDALLGTPTDTLSFTITDDEEPEVISPIPESDLLEITIGGKTIFVYKDGPESKLAKGFHLTSQLIGDTQVKVAKNPMTGVMLIYLVLDNGSEVPYIYDADSQTLQPFIQVSTTGYYKLLQPVDQIQGFRTVSLVFNGQVIEAMKKEGSETLYLVYAENDLGNQNYYVLDLHEGTLQRTHLNRINPEIQKVNNSFKYLIVALLVLSVSLLVVILLLRKKL